MCPNKCIKINDLCQNTSNSLLCSEQFHRHCQQTNDKNQVINIINKNSCKKTIHFHLF